MEKELLPCQIDFILNRTFKDGIIDYLCKENFYIRLEVEYDINEETLCSMDKKVLDAIKRHCSSCARK